MVGGSDELPGFAIGTHCNIWKNLQAIKADEYLFLKIGQNYSGAMGKLRKAIENLQKRTGKNPT